MRTCPPCVTSRKTPLFKTVAYVVVLDCTHDVRSRLLNVASCSLRHVHLEWHSNLPEIFTFGKDAYSLICFPSFPGVNESLQGYCLGVSIVIVVTCMLANKDTDLVERADDQSSRVGLSRCLGHNTVPAESVCSEQEV